MQHQGEVRDLGSRIADGERVEVPQAVYIILASCKATAHADPRGVIHPGRILISQGGDVTIGDLDLTADDLGYVAPEFGNADGEADIDRPRAVVFSLGCVLWELIAGRRLFVGSTDYQTVQLARGAHVPPLAHVDLELEAIVRKALASSVDDRYQTPGELGEALADYLMERASN